LLQGIFNKSRLDAEDQKLALRLNIPDDSHRPLVNVDMEQIVRVFNNLIANSIKHTPENGTITIGFTLSNDKVVFHIQDTGTGINEDDLPNIFNRFYKGDKSRSANSGGSGLGLAIAKEIVEYHGGEIWVENNPVGGATFHFSLKTQ